MNTKAMRTSAWSQLSQEDDPVVNLLVGDMEILDSGKPKLKLIHFMVMRSEQCFGALLRIMQKFCDTAGDGNTIIGRCPPAYFIQDDKTPW
jgi:hypothetical protein